MVKTEVGEGSAQSASPVFPGLMPEALGTASDTDTAPSPSLGGTLAVFTDGSFDKISRMGGWAFVVMAGDSQVHQNSGTGTGHSNNSIEVLAVLEAMSWIDASPHRVNATVWTDSLHVMEGCRRWRFIWRHNGWKRIDPNPRARRRALPDASLWQKLDVLLDRHPHVALAWCKGHSGIVGNDHADRQARLRAKIGNTGV